jgi:DNA-binding NtrC family response regulator
MIKSEFEIAKEAFEKEFIKKALNMYCGNLTKTALHLNIGIKLLYDKLKKYNMNEYLMKELE